FVLFLFSFFLILPSLSLSSLVLSSFLSFIVFSSLASSCLLLSYLVLSCLELSIYVLSFSKHPYVLVNQNRSWVSAQSFCRRNHRDLVTVDSDEENQALLSLMEEQEVGQIWIGLHRPQWNWSDGSVYQFSHWGKNQDKLKENWSCVAIRNRKWKRQDCSKQLDFLCEGKQPFSSAHCIHRSQNKSIMLS
uniref:C-type lectin domain-containing protein n=1 Tax=Gouania willdenowi TaxID=441366 RepID=A0A8C5DY57_GOUWI